MIWSDYPLGSTAIHDLYELSVTTTTLGPQADGSYLWNAIVGLESPSAFGNDGGMISAACGLTSREAAKAAAVGLLATVIDAARVSDADLIALAQRVVRSVRPSVIDDARVGSVAVAQWARGDRPLPTYSRRIRAVIALRRIEAETEAELAAARERAKGRKS